MRLASQPVEVSAGEIPHERMAHAELRATPYVGLHRVECRLSGCRLVLSGKVSSFFLKQVAQSVLLRRFGSGLAIENRLEVIPERDTNVPEWG
uniref:BON domain-containing protein n=1 Tax=Schlesneria paludicola TaxID=360056 RepID=A0A7C4LLF6_9PLAN